MQGMAWLTHWCLLRSGATIVSLRDGVNSGHPHSALLAVIASVRSGVAGSGEKRLAAEAGSQ